MAALVLALVGCYWAAYKFVRQTERGQAWAGILIHNGNISWRTVDAFFAPADHVDAMWYRTRYRKILPGGWVDASGARKFRIDSALHLHLIEGWESWGLPSGTVCDFPQPSFMGLTSRSTSRIDFELLLIPWVDGDRLTLHLSGTHFATETFSRVKPAAGSSRSAP